MSSIENYDSWRLQTNSGIRYRFLGTTGSFQEESGEVEWKAVIRAQDLLAVLNELFPPPQIIGNVVIPRPGHMPGVPALSARRLTYKAFESSKPIEPFAWDTNAPLGTYTGFLEIAVNFGVTNNTTRDPNDPRTFLEITGTAGGEFIYAPPGASQLKEETVDGTKIDTPGKSGVDEKTGEAKGEVTEVRTKKNRHPVLPATIVVPTVEWKVRWKQIPAAYFRNVAIHRLRAMMGRVNSHPVRFLYNAYPETLLFMGFTHTESFSWRGNNVESPPIDIEMSFQEKRVMWNGVVCGHNHVWEPGRGWQRYVLSTGESPYKLWDLNFVFKV